MTIPTLSGLGHGVPGAVAGEGRDAGVPAHYGNPFGEQRRLRGRGGLVDRSHRGVLRICGPDRLSWLHSLTSQHLLALGQTAVEALVLSPHGHVEHHLVASDDGEATWVSVEPETATALAAYLDSMRFMLRVEVADVSADYDVLTVVGPVPEVLHPAPAAVQGMPWGTDLVVARADVPGLVAALDLVPAGHAAFEALRVEAGRPRLGAETDHRTIPHEIGWLATAVHLDKGCYRGQETVARVHNLGRPPRRLVRGHLDGSRDELPPPGTPVELDGRVVGFLGTAVQHAELGPVALAVVKRNLPDDAQVTVEGMAMAMERVVDV